MISDMCKAATAVLVAVQKRQEAARRGLNTLEYSAACVALSTARRYYALLCNLQR